MCVSASNLDLLERNHQHFSTINEGSWSKTQIHVGPRACRKNDEAKTEGDDEVLACFSYRLDLLLQVYILEMASGPLDVDRLVKKLRSICNLLIACRHASIWCPWSERLLRHSSLSLTDDLCGQQLLPSPDILIKYQFVPRGLNRGHFSIQYGWVHKSFSKGPADFAKQ